jgi:hypothetical protein
MTRWLFGPVILALLLAVSSRALTTSSAQTKAVTFKADVAPLLNEKCQPCHFKGGKMFDKLPFDDYKTVLKIASRLNTRLKGKDADLVTRWIDGGAVEN